MNYFKNHDTKKLMGFDLRIDSKIQEVCDLSNKSSSHTRAVLYVLVIISITSIIAVINTWPYGNWTKERIEYKRKEIDSLNSLIENINGNGNGALSRQAHEKELIKNNLQHELNKEIENKRDKIGIVELPVIGNTFDVNNLSVFTGVSFIIVLLILRYTASREKKNLRFALHAITQRYPDPQDYLNAHTKVIDIVPDTLITQNDPAKSIILDDAAVMKFNVTRRRYHYYYLTMNEVFNTPEDPLTKFDKNEANKINKQFKKTFVAKVVEKNLLFFPFIVYTIILINDIFSSFVGFEVSKFHTIFQLALSYFFLSYIATLCYECNKQKLISLIYFDDFANNDYKYEFAKTTIDFPKRKIHRLIYPLWLIATGLFSAVRNVFIRR